MHARGESRDPHVTLRAENQDSERRAWREAANRTQVNQRFYAFSPESGARWPRAVHTDTRDATRDFASGPRFLYVFNALVRLRAIGFSHANATNCTSARVHVQPRPRQGGSAKLGTHLTRPQCVELGYG